MPDVLLIDDAKPKPRQTADAELRESVERLTECQARTLDALDAFCEAFGALPASDHVRYHERVGRLLGVFEGQLRQARAVLLGTETT